MTRRYLPVLLIPLLLLALWLFADGRPQPRVVLLAPLTGGQAAVGEAIRRGAERALEQAREHWTRNGTFREPALVILDDRGDSRRARQLRAEQAKRDDVVALIEYHGRDDAGLVGQQPGLAPLPILSLASAARADLAADSWYFSLMPDDVSQAGLSVGYMRLALGVRRATLVHGTDRYARGLSQGFVSGAAQFRLQLAHRFELTDGSPEAIGALAEQLRALDDPGMVYLALDPREGAELIVSLRGTGIRFFAPDALGDASFLDTLRAYPQEQVQPGYFADGVHVMLPWLPDIGTRRTKEFVRDFSRRYGTSVDWAAAASHDALGLVLTGLQALPEWDAGQTLADPGIPRQLREPLRDWLATRNLPARALDGVSGRLQFNPNGASVNPLPVARYRGHRLVPALEQFQLVRDETSLEDPLLDVLEGRMLYFDHHLLHRTRVLYSGIDVNGVGSVDEDGFAFNADFFLWFRGRDPVNPAQIEFVNADGILELKEPMLEQRDEEGLITQTWRVQGNYRTGFDYSRFPFDQQELAVRLRHRQLTRDSLIFAPDVSGMRPLQQAEQVLRDAFVATGNWRLDNLLFFQDEIANESTLGVERRFGADNALEYSRLNVVMNVHRDWGSFVIKNLFPMFFVMLLSYTTFYMTNFNPRMNTNASAMLTAAFFHLKLSGDIPVSYLVALEYFFFSVYVLIALSILATIYYHVTAEAYAEGGEAAAAPYRRSRRIDRICYYLFPAVSLLLAISVVLIFARPAGG